MSNQHKNPTISFRITDAERKQIEARILASGLMKKDYFIRSCIYNRICVVGKKETIYPLVQTVNALYLQLLEMQKVFTATSNTSNTLPSSETIKELHFRFGMYNPATDSIIVNTGENSILVICCKQCNSSVIFDDPNDIVYLYWLAEESPLLYAKLALRENGLQDYVDAMNEFN